MFAIVIFDIAKYLRFDQ